MGCIGGADRTFAYKSQECLWKDWYILHEIFYEISCEMVRFPMKLHRKSIGKLRFQAFVHTCWHFPQLYIFRQ